MKCVLSPLTHTYLLLYMIHPLLNYNNIKHIQKFNFKYLVYKNTNLQLHGS